MAITNRDKFIKKYNLDKNGSYGLDDIARITGIQKSILQEVYNRGIGAHKQTASVRLIDGTKNYSTSIVGKMSKEQWAISRVYSFVMKGTTYYTADSDLVKKIKS